MKEKIFATDEYNFFFLFDPRNFNSSKTQQFSSQHITCTQKLTKFYFPWRFKAWSSHIGFDSTRLVKSHGTVEGLL